MWLTIFLILFVFFVMSIVYSSIKIISILRNIYKTIYRPLFTIFTRAIDDKYIEINVENIGLFPVNDLKINLGEDFVLKRDGQIVANLKEIQIFNETIKQFNPKEIIKISLGDKFKIYETIQKENNPSVLTFYLSYNFEGEKHYEKIKLDLNKDISSENIKNNLLDDLLKVTESISGLLKVLKEIKKPDNTISLN